jgi:hypothetical protein
MIAAGEARAAAVLEIPGEELHCSDRSLKHLVASCAKAGNARTRFAPAAPRSVSLTREQVKNQHHAMCGNSASLNNDLNAYSE